MFSIISEVFLIFFWLFRPQNIIKERLLNGYSPVIPIYPNGNIPRAYTCETHRELFTPGK